MVGPQVTADAAALVVRVGGVHTLKILQVSYVFLIGFSKFVLDTVLHVSLQLLLRGGTLLLLLLLLLLLSQVLLGSQAVACCPGPPKRQYA